MGDAVVGAWQDSVVAPGLPARPGPRQARAAGKEAALPAVAGPVPAFPSEVAGAPGCPRAPHKPYGGDAQGGPGLPANASPTAAPPPSEGARAQTRHRYSSPQALPRAEVHTHEG